MIGRDCWSIDRLDVAMVFASMQRASWTFAGRHLKQRSADGVNVDLEVSRTRQRTSCAQSSLCFRREMDL
jgi:hypothetical protein